MQAGNKSYVRAEDLPETVPVFPLAGALLLPGGQMPLNIFEPRFLSMFDSALAGDRLVAMVQPALDGSKLEDGEPDLCAVGCVGRVTGLQETGDGRYLVTLSGICRFRIIEEMATPEPFRRCHMSPFLGDLDDDAGDAEQVDRELLLTTFRQFLEANDMETDWDSIARAGNDVLVNSLSMLSPYGPAEKQALLEAESLKARAETLIAITQMTLARSSDDVTGTLQ
ncbi:MAG: LON peptidase substrate-binding domain-containing protein [Pseudomonadota bacterium]